MKFDSEDFVAKPLKYFFIGLALCLVAAVARNPSIAEWNTRFLFSTFSLPLLAGVLGYILLKRKAKK